jgi:hypothetical protein
VGELGDIGDDVGELDDVGGDVGELELDCENGGPEQKPFTHPLKAHCEFD